MKVSSFVFTIFICLLSLSSFVHSQSDSCNSNPNLGTTISFNTTSLNCHPVWGAQNFILRYGQSGPQLWDFVLSAPNPNSYVAVGFSPNGRMVGSSAMVGWIAKNGTGIIKQYYLGATSERGVRPDQGNLPLVSSSAAIVQLSSRLYLAFQLSTAQPEARLIYSVGPRNVVPLANNLLVQHQDKVSTHLNYATGETSTKGTYNTLRKSHGILNMVGWGILMPIGAGIARYTRQWDPAWFYAHISFQVIAFAMGLLAVILGFRLQNKLSADVDRHKTLGVIILALGCLQIMAFLARPDKASKLRKYWNWYHYSVGRVLIVLAVANIFYGISLVENDAAPWNIGYGVALGFLALLSLFLEVRKWVKK